MLHISKYPDNKNIVNFSDLKQDISNWGSQTEITRSLPLDRGKKKTCIFIFSKLLLKLNISFNYECRQYLLILLYSQPLAQCLAEMLSIIDEKKEGVEGGMIEICQDGRI